MTFINDRKISEKPRLSGTIMVLLSVFVIYPVVGSLLTMLATGGRHFGTEPHWMTGSLKTRLLAVQASGQFAVLALPVFWLARRFSGDRVSGRDNLAWLGIGKPGGFRAAGLAGAGMLLLQPLLYSLVELQSMLLPYLGEPGRSLLQEQARLDQFIRALVSGSSPLSSFLSVLVLVVTPAFCEELFFRGYIQKSFAASMSPGRAVLVSGVVFALFHMEWFNLLPLTLLGWYIGFIYVKSDNLLVPAVAHAANNAAALVLLKSDNLSGSPAQAASAVFGLWQWWALVLGSLYIFSLLIRYFPDKPAITDTNNSMTGGHS